MMRQLYQKMVLDKQQIKGVEPVQIKGLSRSAVKKEVEEMAVSA